MMRERGRPGGAATERLDLARPRDLALLGNLELVARGVVEGFLIGLHRSPHRGFSAEFAEHRHYNPGDDLRFLDWKAYGRSDRPYVKQFQHETNLRAWLLLDGSASMAWSADPAERPTKLEYGRLLAASLALLLLRQGDAAGLIAFDEEVRVQLAPRTTRAHWWRLLAALAGVEGAGGTDAAGAAAEVAARMRRRGMAVVISDFLVDPGPARRAVRMLRHAGHEVLLFHILDPGELELPAAGEAVFFDPETGEEVQTSSSALRRDYRAAVERELREWRASALGMGADYSLLTTDRPLGPALGRALERRAWLR